jgi:pimeloyl-ACP methyl ester carboxylesterase
MTPIRGLSASHGTWPLPLIAATVLLYGSASTPAGEPDDGLAVRAGSAELRFAAPYQAGRVPVVFVHGMLGSPGNWSALIDRLAADPSVRERSQFLTFGYDSLQPIPESGRELLEALIEARRRTDPDGRDPAFDHVVLVGHSLGGLVIKSAAVHAADPRQTGAAGPSPDGRGQPAHLWIGRLIYVATPHRGSPVDRGAVRSAGSWLARNIISPPTGRGTPTTSVDQLTWDDPLLAELERARAARGTPFHSIIATLGDPSAEGATDGLVPVASARLAGARSEVVVRTHHICFQDPEVVREVRRVLVEHATPPHAFGPGRGPGPRPRSTDAQ